MSKLGLPKDMGDKVLAMLKPKVRPVCVLIFYWDCGWIIKYKTNALGDTDRDFIVQLDYERVWGRDEEVEEVHILGGSVDTQVHNALLTGFRFQDEAARARWKHKKDFEMYRDAVHYIA